MAADGGGGEDSKKRGRRPSQGADKTGLLATGGSVCVVLFVQLSEQSQANRHTSSAEDYLLLWWTQAVSEYD